jgi:chromosome segregation ATPase
MNPLKEQLNELQSKLSAKQVEMRTAKHDHEKRLTKIREMKAALQREEKVVINSHYEQLADEESQLMAQIQRLETQIQQTDPSKSGRHFVGAR